MDYFFAQVEIRDNPKLKGKPVGIGGPKGGRGVLATCNYEARAFGVSSAMPTYKALERCPKLILVSPDMKKYVEASNKVFEVFHEFTDIVQGLSLDEAFLDVSEIAQNFDHAKQIALEIKERIFEETGLTGSAGISYNKLLSKISSDLNKPNGIFMITPAHVEEKIQGFPVKYISGVGKVTNQKMERFGIKTFGDLGEFSKLDLINTFGSFGPALYNYARGIDDRVVSSGGQRKSLSVEHTYNENISDFEQINIKIGHLFERMTTRLQKHDGKLIKGIFVKIKYGDFTQTTIENKRNEYTLSDFQELFFKRFSARGEPVRLIGIGVRFYSSPNGDQLQLDFFKDDENTAPN